MNKFWFLFALNLCLGKSIQAIPDSTQWHLMQFNSGLEKDRLQKFETLGEDEYFEFLMDAQALNLGQRQQVRKGIDDLINHFTSNRKAKHYGQKEILKVYNYLINTFSLKQNLSASLLEFFKTKQVSLPSLMFVMAKIYTALDYSWRFERSGADWLAFIGNGEEELSSFAFGESATNAEDFGFLLKNGASEFATHVLGSDANQDELNAYAESLYNFDQKFDWRGMVSLQYFFNALVYLHKSEFEKPISPLLKAQILGASNYVNWATFYCISKVIDADWNENFNKITKNGYYIVYFYNNYHYPINNIMMNFESLAYNELTKSSKTEKFNACYQFFSKHLKNTELKNELSFTYHWEMARYLILKQSRTAFPHLRQVQQRNPNHVQLPYLSYGCVYITMKDKFTSNEKYAYDSLMKISSDFPKAVEDPEYPGMVFRTIVSSIYYYTDRNETINSYRYYQKLVTFLNEGTYSPNTSVFLGFFEHLGAFYSREKEYAKSRIVLLYGLKFANEHDLDSSVLQTKYNIIKNR